MTSIKERCAFSLSWFGCLSVIRNSCFETWLYIKVTLVRTGGIMRFRLYALLSCHWLK